MEYLYFRDANGQPCGPGNRRMLFKNAGDSPKKIQLEDSRPITWNAVKSSTSIDAGNWQVVLHYDSDENGSDPQVNVLVERRNSSCVVQQTIIDEILTLGQGQTGAVVSTAPVNPGQVSFGSGDMILVIVELLDGDVDVEVKIRYNGPNPGNDDSRLTLPDDNGAILHLADTLIVDRKELTHTIDSFIVIHGDILHKTDCLVAAKDRTRQHLTDALVRPTGDETFHATDCCISETNDNSFYTDSVIRIPTEHATDSYICSDYRSSFCDTFIAPRKDEIGGQERTDFWVCRTFNTPLVLEELYKIGIFADVHWVGFSPIDDKSTVVSNGWLKVNPEDPGVVKPNATQCIVGYTVDEETGQMTCPDIAYPCEVRIFTVSPLSEEKKEEIEELLLAHDCENSTDRQESEKKDENDLDILETYFNEDCWSHENVDEIVCILARLILRRERDLII